MRMRVLHTMILFMLSATMIAQSSPNDNSLGSQFETMKKESNNYQIYKVVKVTTLDAFWQSAKDSLRKEQSEIKALRNEISQLSAKVIELNAAVAERDTSLEAQAHNIEHMDFLGMSLTKGVYKTISWILIVALLLIAIVLFIRFNSAHQVTSQTRKDYQILQDEFDLHRQKTRENETKLKRDLQTEINKYEELKGELDKKN